MQFASITISGEVQEVRLCKKEERITRWDEHEKSDADVAGSAICWAKIAWS